MRQQKIEWCITSKFINQLYRSGLEYAFVSKDYRQVGPLVYCKDFLQDALFGFLWQTKVFIHGYTYDPKTQPPICIDRTRIILACSKDFHFREKIPGMLDFLNKIEFKLRMKKTILKECKDVPPKYNSCGIWLLEGSRRWLISPPMLSMYTLMIRIGLVHKSKQIPEKTMTGVEGGLINGYGAKDKFQLKEAKAGIMRIIEYGDRSIFHKNIMHNYPKKLSIRDLHNHCGIVGFSQEYTKQFIPYWHRRKS